METLALEQIMLSLKEQNDKQISLKGSQQTLTSTLSNKQQLLNNMEKITPEQISTIEDQITSNEQDISKLRFTLEDITRNEVVNKRRNTIKQKLNKLLAELSESFSSELVQTIYTENYQYGDLNSAQSIEENHARQMAICQKYGIGYNSEAITSKIQEYSTFINHVSSMEKLLPKLEQIRSLEKEINSLNVEETSSEMVAEKTHQYNEVKNSLNVLFCPHCNGSVRYSNSKLIIANTSIQNEVTDIDVKNAETEMKKIMKQYEQWHEKQRLVKQLGEIPLHNRSLVEQYISVSLAPYHSAISELSSVEVISLPLSSSVFLKKAIGRAHV